MTEKKKPEDLTTEEAVRRLFPAKAVREARKQAVPEPSEGEKPQVDAGERPIEDQSRE
jgi:hypothetical protein